MHDVINPAFSDIKYSDDQSWQKINALPPNFEVERAQTQINVNETVLNYLVQKFVKGAPLQMLDLPCGMLEFSSYVKQLFPKANITAVDIMPQKAPQDIHFVQMDVSRPFIIPDGEQFDLITSMSGIMMFSNTKLFIENCISRLKKGGTIIITNDNSATLKDKLTYLLFGTLRMFPPVYADTEFVTENVSVQELIRLLRTNGIAIKDVVYTASTAKDYLLWPLYVLLYPLHRWYLRRVHTNVPKSIINKMYPFKHLYCRHYIVIAEK